MTILCDQLCAWICAKALARRLRGFGADRPMVLVLDAQDAPVRHALFSAALRLVGIRAVRAEFNADELRLPDGASPIPTARQALSAFLTVSSEDWMRSAPALARLNSQWERDTLRLCLMKQMYWPAFAMARRLYCAVGIAMREGLGHAEICLDSPPGLAHRHAWPNLPEGVSVHLGTRFLTKVTGGIKNLVQIARMAFSLAMRSYRSQPQAEGHRQMPPGLLLLEEDVLGTDKTRREQPHWLPGPEAPFPYPIFLLGTAARSPEPATLRDLSECGVSYLPTTELFGTAPMSHALEKEVRRAALTALLGALARLASTGDILLAAVRLFLMADAFAGLCTRRNIKAFMSNETHFALAMAMTLIAPRLGVKTFAGQYSNIRCVPFIMLSTCDLMFTFAPRYHGRWAYRDIGPRAFADTGYIYGHAFELLKQRSKERRERLLRAGAQCILCYFDENFFSGRYSHLTPETHWNEYRGLLEACLADSALALLLKPQFNVSLSKPAEIQALTDELKALGRYEEFQGEGHRSAYFPAEAALCADIAIGDLSGGTASLEAALTGTRSIIINPRNVDSLEMELYRQADILYPNLPAALEAIRAFREGRPERQNLGDWRPIITHFDPFRDGRAAERTRAQLQTTLASSAGTPPIPCTT